jgi:hypothetical protein
MTQQLAALPKTATCFSSSRTASVASGHCCFRPRSRSRCFSFPACFASELDRPMHLAELLLPLNDNGGRPLGPEKYTAVREHLIERFGGVTAFTRSPAQDTTTDKGKTVHDEIVVFEVMTKPSTPRGGAGTDVSWRGNSGRTRSWSGLVQRQSRGGVLPRIQSFVLNVGGALLAFRASEHYPTCPSPPYIRLRPAGRRNLVCSRYSHKSI